MAPFDEKLAEHAAEIERALEILLSTERLTGPDVPPDRLIAAMRHGTLNGGKRIRPFLLRQTAEMLGLAPELTIAAAVAVELIHCYSLIHADLPAMDDDDLRRGQPTVHKAYDDATAILAGAALLTRAFECEIAPLDRLVIARMQAMKTGALIRTSIRMGAILGGADNDTLGHLTHYAEAAGRAFQIADDLLDVTASAEAMGKATGKDAGLNKQTLVSLLGVEAAQRHLGDVVHDAITALTPFGREADTLRAAARYFATREN